MLGAAAGAALAACTREPPAYDGRWVGASAARGHRLRDAHAADTWPTPELHCDVVVAGAGIAGLAAARALRSAGIDDHLVLDLEPQAGGNSRGMAFGGQRCPLGAHYLPLPDDGAHEVRELLFELGLLRHELGRTRADERHLCHSPQERLFFNGAWHDGLLPPAAPGSTTLALYRRFAAEVAAVQTLGFALPTQRAPWTAAHQALDAQTFAVWLDERGFNDAQLRWYLDYACRDDYGAGLATVSAWAGLHYFASRHGFHAPGDDDAEREPVFTWPEGNAWLAERLAAPLGPRLRTGHTVLAVREAGRAVQVLAWDEAAQRPRVLQARAAVLALPLFIAQRVLQEPPDALRAAAVRQRHAPWLVANLHLAAPLLERADGPPLAWDNVAYGARSLGYVNDVHQSLRPDAGGTVLTAYWALPEADRPRLLADDWRAWAAAVVADLAAMHPDLGPKLREVALMRYGHAMSIPVPGVRSDPALQALAQQRGRVQFAHADLSGYSVFEEAYTHGLRAGRAAAQALRGV